MQTMSYWYDRDGNPCPDVEPNFPKGFFNDRRVARTVLPGCTVSTVWLGLNHSFGEGPPLIFETMVFGELYDGELQRYSTEEGAVRGHLKVLDRLRAGLPPFSDEDDQ